MLSPKPTASLAPSSIFSAVLILSACWAPVEPNEDPIEDPACTPGELRCNGSILELCVDDGASFAALEICAAPPLCDPELGCQSPQTTRRGEPLTIPYSIR